MSNSIICFSEIPKIFNLCEAGRFTVSTLEMREREAYRKQTGSNVFVLLNKVPALEHDQFMQVSLYTVS